MQYPMVKVPVKIEWADSRSRWTILPLFQRKNLPSEIRHNPPPPPPPTPSPSSFSGQPHHHKSSTTTYTNLCLPCQSPQSRAHYTTKDSACCRRQPWTCTFTFILHHRSCSQSIQLLTGVTRKKVIAQVEWTMKHKALCVCVCSKHKIRVIIYNFQLYIISSVQFKVIMAWKMSFHLAV